MQVCLHVKFCLNFPGVQHLSVESNSSLEEGHFPPGECLLVLQLDVTPDVAAKTHNTKDVEVFLK